ncbi:MAG: VCBS repeat-containing protein, partial [Sedimentisphaerales bacterium]|nr:VCBS repeat-containing protein [Sedimentisphaerales bacterium]
MCFLTEWVVVAFVTCPVAATDVTWVRKSSAGGDLPAPNAGDQQTCLVVADFDNDGVDDFAIGERTKKPSVVWYKWNGKGWDRFVIEDGHLGPEAGGDACDIDGDGDQDLVLGADGGGNAIWWWENPSPDFGKPWPRRFIKNSGARKHHDQSVGDYDGDDRPELLSWNQDARQLLLYEIPADPKAAETWSPTVIHSWESGEEMEGFPSRPSDIDGDGKVDIVGGGRWFKHRGDVNYEAIVIDDTMRFTQCAAGQLVRGGWAEIVFSPGDADGKAKWYEWKGGKWVAHTLRHVVHGHTCEVRDIDRDGN